MSLVKFYRHTYRSFYFNLTITGSQNQGFEMTNDLGESLKYVYV